MKQNRNLKQWVASILTQSGRTLFRTLALSGQSINPIPGSTCVLQPSDPASSPNAARTASPATASGKSRSTKRKADRQTIDYSNSPG